MKQAGISAAKAAPRGTCAPLSQDNTEGSDQPYRRCPGPILESRGRRKGLVLTSIWLD